MKLCSDYYDTVNNSLPLLSTEQKRKALLLSFGRPFLFDRPQPGFQDQPPSIYIYRGEGNELLPLALPAFNVPRGTSKVSLISF
jgi:hypothetical protein